MNNKKKYIYLLLISFLAMGLFHSATSYKKSDEYSFPLNTFLLHAASYTSEGIYVDASTGEYADVADSVRFFLSKGSYTIIVDYDCDIDSEINLVPDNDQFIDIMLPSNSHTVNCTFTMNHPSSKAIMYVNSLGKGSLLIKNISLKADHKIYNDAIYHSFLCIFLFACIILFVKQWDHISVNKRKEVLILTGIITAVNLPLFFTSYSPFTVDVRNHMMRIDGVMYGLLDGQLPVIIAPNFFNEFGELSFMYPDITLYPAGILRLLNISMLSVYRSHMVVINIFSVLIMYYSLKSIDVSQKNALLLTGIYTFQPNRLYLMYRLGAGAASGTASMFMPLCIVGIYLLLNKKKKGIYMLSIGLSGMMQSHILTFLLACIFITIVCISFAGSLFREKAIRMRMLLKSAMFTILFNFGFLIIFIVYYRSDWDKHGHLNWAVFTEWLISGNNFFLESKNLYYFIVTVLMIILTIFSSKENNIKCRFAILLTFLVTFLYLMTTKIFPWDFILSNSPRINSIVNYFQQPRRFYSLSEPLLVMIPAFLPVSNIKKINSKLKFSLIVIFYAISVYAAGCEFYSYLMSGPLIYDEISGDLYSEVLFDYAPYGLTEESIRSDAGYLSDEESVESTYYKKLGTHIDYEYSAYKDDIYAVLPLSYYEGYKAYNEKGLPLKVEKTENGLIRVWIEEGKHSMHISFHVKRIFTMVFIISVVLDIVIFLYFVVNKTKIEKEVN